MASIPFSAGASSKRDRSNPNNILTIPPKDKSEISNTDVMNKAEEQELKETLHALMLGVAALTRSQMAQAENSAGESSSQGTRRAMNSTMLGGCLVLLIGNLGYSIYWGGQKQAEVSAAAAAITRLEQRIDYVQAQYESTGKQIAELKGLLQGMQKPQR